MVDGISMSLKFRNSQHVMSHKEKKLANPFAGIGKGFKEIFSGFDNLFSGKSHSYIKLRVKEQALAKAETSCFVVYDIFKKARKITHITEVVGMEGYFLV